jgi:hypothetical protein
MTPERRKCAVTEAPQRRPLLGNGSVNTFPRLRYQQWKDIRCWVTAPPEILRFPLSYPLFANIIYSRTESTWLLNRWTVNILHLQFMIHKEFCSYLTGNTLRHIYKDHSVNAV